MQVTQKTNVKHDVEGEHEGCVGVIAAHFEQTNPPEHVPCNSHCQDLNAVSLQ